MKLEFKLSPSELREIQADAARGNAPWHTAVSDISLLHEARELERIGYSAEQILQSLINNAERRLQPPSMTMAELQETGF